MRTRRQPRFAGASALCPLVLALVAVLPAGAQPAKDKADPVSKVFFSEVGGDAQIDTGDRIEDLSQRSVYAAQGAVIETKKSASERDRARHFSTMVYSNGTGAFFDADTRVEVKRFVQEAFIPNRADIDIEPSVSQTQAVISRGLVGLCTSKLVAGSSMTYQTPHASVNIRGRRLVIETTPEVTKISMLEGDSTVRAGPMDMGGHTVRAGQQAIIRPGLAGSPNTIEITRIPPQESPLLDQKVALACAAKKTVYFEVRERPVDVANPAAPDQAAPDSTLVTAFDGNSSAPAFPAEVVLVREIVPVPIVPVNLPVQFTVSPATLPAAGGNAPGG